MTHKKTGYRKYLEIILAASIIAIVIVLSTTQTLMVYSSATQPLSSSTPFVSSSSAASTTTSVPLEDHFDLTVSNGCEKDLNGSLSVGYNLTLSYDLAANLTAYEESVDGTLNLNNGGTLPYASNTPVTVNTRGRLTLTWYLPINYPQGSVTSGDFSFTVYFEEISQPITKQFSVINLGGYPSCFST